jgi:hypothetical protein
MHRKCRQAGESKEIEITRDMVEAGGNVIISESGVAPLGFSFSPDDLAEKVYRAMSALSSKRSRRRP